MIDLEKLKNVKRLVTHANCPDGVASALIVKDAIPDVEVLFVKHGTKEHRELRPDVPTLFCDFTPWTDMKKDAQWLMWLQADTLVLDHHPTQRDVTMAFVEADLGAYGENDRGECGAWLAFEHVWKPLKNLSGYGVMGSGVREFAELAGVRDTWKKDEPRWQAACEQAEALMFWDFERIRTVDRYLQWESFEKRTSGSSLGNVLFEKKLEHARNAIAESHRFDTTKGTRVIVFQGVTPTSDAAEILEKEADGSYSKNADIVAGFHYRVDGGRLQLQFSTRSHTGYDVGAFCKSKGGGGHSAAAGFTVEQSVEIGANPYAVFKLLLEEWEQGQ
jgi:nanoRNase/pAp phosphatase (c-di-AMP/oligoRNAs hydrolase)